MCYIIEYQYYLRKRRDFNFLFIFGCLFLLFAVYYFSTTNVQLAFSQEYIFERKFGSAGTALGEFSQPQGIAIDSSDNIYITSFTSLSNQIQKFTSNGSFITSWVHWVLVPAVLLIHLELQQIL